MATIPEEFFEESLKKLAPPSPPAFLDLTTAPNNGNGEASSFSNDHVPPYILDMLMDDDIDNEILYEDSDHLELLQVQQPFAEILFSPSLCDNSKNTIHRGSPKGTKDLLHSSGNGNQSLDVAGTFLTGIEDASRFLPTENGLSKDEPANQMLRESNNLMRIKRRHNRDMQLEEVGRAKKAMMMMVEELEEMFDEMMLRGYETCTGDMRELRIAKADEAKKNKKKRGRKKKGHIVDLCTLLNLCAQAVARSDHTGAHELLKEIKQHVSSTGDATQRLANCFAKGLEARLAGTGSQLYRLLIADGPSATEILKAYNLYMAACGFNRVAFIFIILTIEHAMAGKNKLHIVDYGLLKGFQWASLFRLMANRKGGPPDMKITAISCFHPMSCPVARIEEIGHRLGKCARNFGVPFKFRPITDKWEAVGIENLDTDADEVLVVNDLFNFHTLMDESIFFDIPSPRDTVLNNIRKMRPDVFIQGILNCSYGTSFLSRFREALFYCRAVFDMLDATIPRVGTLRLVLEQGMLGHSVLNSIACEGMDLVNRPEKYKQWQLRNQRAGLRQLPVKPSIIKVLKDKVKNDYHKDFLLSEDGKWLLQGWMGRTLFAHSTWVSEDAFSE
ncbi:hypothetical protein ACP4OV_002145 [Aristida adscensionis]